jgi:DNA ligase (NAD+)
LVRVLARHYASLDELAAADESELQAIDEIGPSIARSVVTFFEDSDNQDVIDAIFDAGLHIRNPYGETEDRPLDGLTFVFTGELDRWTRDEVQRLVEQHGGRATSSVSGVTDYVVAGPGAGSKLDEAHDRDVPVMDEAEFITFLHEHDVEV